MKVFVAIISFVVVIGVGEEAGPVAGFSAFLAYCFVCQFLLSRGNVDAHRHWPIMLSLPIAIVALIMILGERREVILFQGLGILTSGSAGAYAGAVAAAIHARRAPAQASRQPRLFS